MINGYWQQLLAAGVNETAKSLFICVCFQRESHTGFTSQVTTMVGSLVQSHKVIVETSYVMFYIVTFLTSN